MSTKKPLKSPVNWVNFDKCWFENTKEPTSRPKKSSSGKSAG